MNRVVYESCSRWQCAEKRVRGRLDGYRQALKDHGLPILDYLHLTSVLSEEAGTDAARYILDLAPDERPDAVFSANDTAAVYCMIALKSAGLRIPQDVAFAGFNNDAISKVIEPNLTTVDYPGEIMGSTAITYLVNHLKGISNIYTTNLITLRADIITRASSLKTISAK